MLFAWNWLLISRFGVRFPLEREVLRLKFGLPPEYFDESDKLWNTEEVFVVDGIYTIYGGVFSAQKSVPKVAQKEWFGNDLVTIFEKAKNGGKYLKLQAL